MRPEVYREMAATQDHHWWFVARRQILAALVGGLGLPPDAEILEIGCGTGGNLGMLATFGRLQAMEYDDEARAFAMSLGVCAIARGGLPSPIPFDDGQFDLVCLLDVLEHIDDDCAALDRVGRLLAPSGKLLLTAPAYSWLWSAHDDAHHHYRRYTAGMLRQRALAAGFSVSRLGYFNSLLFPIIAAVRAGRNIAGAAEASDAALPAPWLNRLLTGIFRSERHIVRHSLFPFGTSVLAVFSRTP